MHLSLYVINIKSEIEKNWDGREIETNLQSQSQAFDCTCNWIAENNPLTVNINILIYFVVFAYFLYLVEKLNMVVF